MFVLKSRPVELIAAIIKTVVPLILYLFDEKLFISAIDAIFHVLFVWY